jgi:predicted protein tyrosine phosphatase
LLLTLNANLSANTIADGERAARTIHNLCPSATPNAPVWCFEDRRRGYGSWVLFYGLSFWEAVA